MMFLFLVLSCFLLAMVPPATGNIEMTTTQMAPVVETVPHPMSSPSVANFLVDGDKSVPLRLTTVTYINAKNSTTVVPVLTLSTSVDEIVQQSIVVLTVPDHTASKTTSSPSPSEKPSVQARDWNAPEQTRRCNAPNGWTTLYGTRQPPNPAYGPFLTRGINWDPFGGTIILTGTRKPSTLTHGRRMGENQHELDPIQARNTLSTSTSTALPHVPGIEASSALLKNNDKDEKMYLLLKKRDFWDGLKHAICFLNVYCDDDATERWKEGERALESQLNNWNMEPTAAAAAMADPTPDLSLMAITSFASNPSPTSTAASKSEPESAAGVTAPASAPAFHQDLEPLAKRSENNETNEHIENSEHNENNATSNMNENVSLATEDFWDDVTRGARSFWCWMLPFTCRA